MFGGETAVQQADLRTVALGVITQFLIELLRTPYLIADDDGTGHVARLVGLQDSVGVHGLLMNMVVTATRLLAITRGNCQVLMFGNRYHFSAEPLRQFV